MCVSNDSTPAVLTAVPAGRAALSRALDGLDAGRLLVVVLCAGWCGACREFRPVFERIAQSHADASFLWLDVEDDSALIEDIDVENFPTLAVYGPAGPLHYGVSLPHESVVARLVETLVRQSRVIAAEPAVEVLPALLRQLVAGSAQQG